MMTGIDPDILAEPEIDGAAAAAVCGSRAFSHSADLELLRERARGIAVEDGAERLGRVEALKARSDEYVEPLGGHPR